VYTIQHAKGGLNDEDFDFSDVSFILTANPPSIQYEQDDLRALSAAEQRRVVSMDVPYEKEDARLEEILKSILKHDPGARTIRRGFKDLFDHIPWDTGVKLFKNLNPDASIPIPHDVSYTAVAQALLQGMVLSSRSSEANFHTEMGKAVKTHILNGIKDSQVRDVLQQQAMNAGIRFEEEVIL
jgi:hypothetical protein